MIDIDPFDPAELDEINAVIDALNERIATCHERHACPKCGAVRGARCYRVGRTGMPTRGATPLKHSHAERRRLEVPDR